MLAACSAAVVVAAGDGAASAYGLAPAVVYGWLVRPARLDRRGAIPFGLSTTVLLAHLVAFAAGGDGWEGAAAAVVGIVVVDRALELVAWLVRPRG